MIEQVWLVKFKRQKGVKGSKALIDVLCRMDLWGRKGPITRLDMSSSRGEAYLYGQPEGIYALRRSSLIISTRLEEGEAFQVTLLITSDNWKAEWRRIITLLEEWLMVDDILETKVIEENAYNTVLQLVCERALVEYLIEISMQGGMLECTEVIPL